MSPILFAFAFGVAFGLGACLGASCVLHAWGKSIQRHAAERLKRLGEHLDAMKTRNESIQQSVAKCEDAARRMGGG